MRKSEEGRAPCFVDEYCLNLLVVITTEENVSSRGGWEDCDKDELV